MISVEEARDILRLDGPDNDDIIRSLLYAIPDYLEITTGYTVENGMSDNLAKTTAGFLLQLWYNAEGTDAYKLQRTIDNLLKALTMTARRRGHG